MAPDEIERRAIEEYARRKSLSRDQAEQEWGDASPRLRASCRAAVRIASRMASSPNDRMVRPSDLVNR